MKRTLLLLIDIFLRQHQKKALKPALVQPRIFTPEKSRINPIKFAGIGIFLMLNLLTTLVSRAQTTYDFSTPATLSYGTGAPYWYNQANITIDGVDYKITSAGNGSLSNESTGGSGNSKCLQKEGSGGDQFILSRADNKPFQFYGFWIKHQSMNNYAEFYSLPPWYVITYNKVVGAAEIYNDNTPMQGAVKPGVYTSSSTAFTKDLTVKSVSIFFYANYHYWIDDIKVGPATSGAPAITVQPSNKTACIGSNTGFSVTATSATGYQWKVNTGSGFTNITNGAPYSGATTASLTITGATSTMDGNLYQCVASGSGTITSNSATLSVPTITTSGSNTNVSCNAGSDGSATVVASGGVAPYSYSWAPSGGTAATASGLTAGEYTVTITDANTCTTTQNFTIIQPPAFAVTPTQTDVSCNGGSNGEASVAVTGGTGSYTYSWSPSGGTGATASGLTAGKYTVTVADANTCNTTQNFTIIQPAAVTATATPSSATVCSGSATDIVLSSNTSGVSFTWTAATVSGNVAGASAGTGSAIAQTLTGNGVIKYVITPANATCTGASITVVVTVNALTSIDSHPTGSNIYDEENTSFSVTATSATGFQWQVDNGNGLINIQNQAPYSGANTTTLNITNATGDLNGYAFRCIVTGNCAPVISKTAVLGVKTRTVQKIVFPATREVTYGDVDFTPDAISDGGLELTYSSSDENIATILDGKIHIKKIGQAIITAGQPGDDDFKPAKSVTQQLTINRKDLVVTLNSTPQINKTYDGTTRATLTAGNYTITGLVGSDDVTVEGTAYFNDSKAGTNKNITVNNFALSGKDIENYNLTTTTSDVKGDITKKDITVTLNSKPLISKIYDATAEAQLGAGNYTLTGLIGEDQTGITGKAAYSDKNAGSGKVVSVSDFILDGQDKDNYSLTTSSATTTGNIEVKQIGIALSAASAITKVYDGTTHATTTAGNYQLQQVEKGDDLSVSGTAEYDNPNAGTNKKVSVSGFVLSGTDKDNYSLGISSDLTTGSITQKSISVTLQQTPVVTKVYDGNTDAMLSSGNYLVTGIVGSDDVVLNNPANGAYDNKNGGLNIQVTVSGLEISGNHAGNYSLVSTTAEAAIGTITPKEIKVVAQAQTKQYGENDPDLTYKTEGKLEQDELTGSLTRATGKNVGDYAISIGSVSGGDNYTISKFAPSVMTITPAPLVITAEDKTKPQGTLNPSFTFRYGGLVAGDLPSDLSIPAVATSTAATGSPIGYYDIVAAGAVSNNYTITFTKGKLTVTPAGSQTHSLKTWSSSPDMLQIRIYTDVAQKAAIILYTESGQQVILQQRQLQKGINSFSMPVGHLSSSTYVLGVAAEKFKDSQKVNVK
ncbi:YDG domain-containing protein [Flavitalea sp.]|nr:YDG domain-containing protein [Flavitalea sp.]